MPCPPHEFLKRGGNVDGAHERLTHQDRSNAGCPKAQNILACADAAFTNQANPGGDARRQLKGPFQLGDKRPQVAVVDADQGRPGVEHPRQLARVVRMSGADTHERPETGAL